MREDIVGKRFGMLEITDFRHSSEPGELGWVICSCDCGAHMVWVRVEEIGRISSCVACRHAKRTEVK